MNKIFPVLNQNVSLSSHLSSQANNKLNITPDISRIFDTRSGIRFMKINQKKKDKETSEIGDPNFLVVF